MKVILLVVAAVLVGGGYVASVHANEIQRAIHNTVGNAQTGNTNFTTEPENQESVSLSPSPSGSQVAAIGTLSIVDSQMYYHAASHVIVKNTGSDAVLLQSVSYGQNTSPTVGITLQPGEQQQISLTQVTGTIGSRYMVQVQGTSNGKVVTAQTSAALKEPISKLETTYSQINIINGGGNPTLQLTLLNSGMNAISITGIKCGKPIPTSLWATAGQSVQLPPNEEKTLNIQFDSLDYLGAKHQNPDGTVTYLLPQAGWTKDVTVTGVNSLGNTISIVVVVPVTVSTVQTAPEVAAGIRISISDAAIHIDKSGSYTVSFTIKNNSTSDMVIYSFKVKGVELPGSRGLNMIAGTTFAVKAITSGGITSSDIGSSVDVAILGQVLASDSQNGAAATPVYANAYAQVLSP
jgi:hypothetical protein